MALLDFFRKLGGQQAMQPAGLLGAEEQPRPGMFGRMTGGLSNFNENHPGLVFGAGQLIAGNDMTPAFTYAAGAKKDKRAQQAQAQKDTATKRYLVRQGYTPEEADEIIGTGNAAAFIKPKGANGEGDVRFSVQPELMEDKDGNLVYGTFGTDGTFRPVDTGDYKATSPTKTIDTPTEVIIQDRFGRTLEVIPKDLRGASRETGIGKGEGEAADLQASMGSKMPGLEKVVAELDVLANQATYTGAGQVLDWGNRQLGLEPREAAVARTKYIAMVDNQVLPLLRETFGAAFTVKEGETLRATLGDPNMSPKEKKVVLEAFIEQKRRDMEALARRTNQQQQQGGGDQYKQKYGLE